MVGLQRDRSSGFSDFSGSSVSSKEESFLITLLCSSIIATIR